MSVDQDQFRTIMARFATGVTVMTTLTPDGEPHGMTANAFTSVSLEPALVLVCVERGHAADVLVGAAGRFGISILASDQRDLSNHFADPLRPAGAASFEGVETFESSTGVPLLVGSLGWVDCQVHAIYEGGDHDIVVGEVVAAGLGERAPALGYFHSRYVTVPPPP